MTAESDTLSSMTRRLRQPRTIVAERRGDSPMCGRPRDVLRWITMVEWQTRGDASRRPGLEHLASGGDMVPLRIVENPELDGLLPPGATPPAWEAHLEAVGG